ncbi:unnamed protein product [Hermetia illucens]|uniref:Lipase n=1 Tax=Hermetia illucens TaxID=343691 RepID=A0A7R8UDF2_HERIL|nr:unnamed protein product [Hermetia illucens]
MISFRLLVIVVSGLILGSQRVLVAGTFARSSVVRSILDRSLAEDAKLTAPELIGKYRYPIEIHKVQTTDGYFLEVHRIPNSNGVPVLLMHGITDSSAGWVLSGPKKGFAYMLADSGYDVWIGNARGNRYSRRHRSLSPRLPMFWNFSFHEIGTYDLPATIDYIIQNTGYPKIHYIGFSQGTTSFWIMCSQAPEYCNKVIVMNALAPVAYLGNSKSPLIVALSRFINQLEVLATLAGIAEFSPTRELLAASGAIACNDKAVTQALCANSIFFIVGYNSEQLNMTNLPVLYGHVPAGASTKQLLHYGQYVKSGLFHHYDYGRIRNLAVYSQPTPPAYNLSRVTAPVALHYGLNDWLTVPKDVKRLASELPNVIAFRQIPHPRFTHGDFMFAIDADTLVYRDVVRIMREAEQKYPISQTKPL